jgi:hypothetical protein
MTVDHLPQPVLSPHSLPALTGIGLSDVLAERVRQIDVDGFTIDRDLRLHPSELALASASYVNTAVDQLHGRDWPPAKHPDTWPWQREAWRPGDARANLVKGAAILLAAIDRIDHAPRDTLDLPGEDKTFEPSGRWSRALGWAALLTALLSIVALGFVRI